MFEQYDLLDKPTKTLMTNVLLATMELILEVGVDEVLSKFKGISENDVKHLPNVKRALQERKII